MLAFDANREESALDQASIAFLLLHLSMYGKPSHIHTPPEHTQTCWQQLNVDKFIATLDRIALGRCFTWSSYQRSTASQCYCTVITQLPWWTITLINLWSCRLGMLDASIRGWSVWSRLHSSRHICPRFLGWQHPDEMAYTQHSMSQPTCMT